jgi:hypothetical protein
VNFVVALLKKKKYCWVLQQIAILLLRFGGTELSSGDATQSISDRAKSRHECTNVESELVNGFRILKVVHNCEKVAALHNLLSDASSSFGEKYFSLRCLVRLRFAAHVRSLIRLAVGHCVRQALENLCDAGQSKTLISPSNGQSNPMLAIFCLSTDSL